MRMRLLGRMLDCATDAGMQPLERTKDAWMQLLGQDAGMQVRPLIWGCREADTAGIPFERIEMAKKGPKNDPK